MNKVEKNRFFLKLWILDQRVHPEIHVTAAKKNETPPILYKIGSRSPSVSVISQQSNPQTNSAAS